MDTEKIKTIMKLFEDSQISKMDLSDGDLHLTLEKEVETVEVIKKKEDKPSSTLPLGQEIKSPLVGTFYKASGVGEKPFVEVGQHVEKGDTICIIEAMKVMNEIKSDVSGIVLSIEVEDGETIEYDQVLMRVGA